MCWIFLDLVLSFVCFLSAAFEGPEDLRKVREAERIRFLGILSKSDFMTLSYDQKTEQVYD